MSLFGKILAIFNVFAMLGAFALLTMDYAKRRTWKYAVFRQELMMTGLPVDKEETDGQGRLLHERIGKQTQTELFGGRSPVTTQLDEIQRVKSELSGKINAAADKKKQIYLYARVLLPLSVTNEQRQQMLSYLTYLKDDASYKNLLQLLEKADTAAAKQLKEPPTLIDENKEAGVAKKAARIKPYEEAFADTLAVQYTDPPGPLAEAFLAVKKANPATPPDKALEQSLDPQLTALQGQFEQAFGEALKIQPPATIYERPVKSDAPSERKRLIAHLLFNMVDVLPDEAPGAPAPKLDLATNENYKRWLIVVGVRAATAAVNDQAALLRDMAAEVAVQRQRERGTYAMEHRKLVDLVVDETIQVDLHDRLRARKKQERETHEEDLKRRRKDVEIYKARLDELREDSAKQLKELRGMSEELYKKRVELRDKTVDNQKLEKKIRDLEYGR